MILRPVRPAVAPGAADHEPPGRVDQDARVLPAAPSSTIGLMTNVFRSRLDLLLRHVFGVLRRDDDRVDPLRLAELVLDRHLALAVWPQVAAACRSCGPRSAGGSAGAPGRSAAASTTRSRCRRSRTSCPGRQRRCRGRPRLALLRLQGLVHAERDVGATAPRGGPRCGPCCPKCRASARCSRCRSGSCGRGRAPRASAAAG